MLVLSRKPGETIVIGDNIIIYLHGIEGGRVKIGVEAPDDVPIVRGEIERKYHKNPPSAPAPTP
jgi:carbon storage regulator